MTIQIEVEKVTPRSAAQWLASQRVNRTIRKEQVRQWAQDMKRGEFPAIAQPIMFDEEGHLIDGQHRLTAVIEAGVSLQMYVARNVPNEHRRYIDGGLKRTAADVLRMDYGISNQTTATAIATMTLMYEHHKDVMWSNPGVRPGKQAVIDEVLENFDEYQNAALVGQSATRLTASKLWLTRTAYGTLSVLVQRHSQVPFEWEAFTDGVSTGANLAKGDPRLTLRSSPIAPGVGGTQRQQYSALACIKTWNAYVRGDELHILRVASPKSLPMPQIL